MFKMQTALRVEPTPLASRPASSPSLPQVLMVRFASLFNVKEKTVTFVSGATYSLEELRAMGMGELLGAMFDFSHKLAALELNVQELGLFTAVVLVSAGQQTDGVNVRAVDSRVCETL